MRIQKIFRNTNWETYRGKATAAITKKLATTPFTLRFSATIFINPLTTSLFILSSCATFAKLPWKHFGCPRHFPNFFKKKLQKNRGNPHLPVD